MSDSTKVRLGLSDWPMEGQGLYGHYLRGEIFEVVKTCKSGLIQIRDKEGNLFSIAKRDLVPVTSETTG